VREAIEKVHAYAAWGYTPALSPLYVADPGSTIDIRL
jgi:hypothetical protein